MMAVFFQALVVWLAAVTTVVTAYGTSPNVFDFSLSTSHGVESSGGRCPPRCACFGATVDCARRGLTRMPTGVPKDTQRLDLQGNELSVIYYSDLANLDQLRILQLHDNKIHTIERGAFKDLQSLERIKLDGNKLRHLPENLFINTPSLYKLDLSHNRLKILGSKLLSGLSGLRYLQMDGNLIRCIDEDALRGLSYLEILTLKDNNITTLWAGTFDHTPRLRALRISGNQLICDCQMAWFSRWLSSAPHLAPYIRCSSPGRLKDRIITDLQQKEFKCAGLVSTPSSTQQCTLSPMCPRGCLCGQGIVDCRDTGQMMVPTHIPDDTIELRLEHNSIKEVPSKAFTAYRLLKRIDLSNNEISTIADDAFYGLSSLNSLVLYGNQIKQIPRNTFRGLTSLQLLLLNANKVECVHPGAFRDLHNLNLLSLYDNNIRTLSNGTFSAMRVVHTMHLGLNPFVCDCQLSWLPEYLSMNPIETSNARCTNPTALNKKTLVRMGSDALKCTPDLSALYSGLCTHDSDSCPHECECDGDKVDCSGRALVGVPRSLPKHTTHLDLSYNELHSVTQTVTQLPKLLHLDLSHNKFTLLPLLLLRAASNLQSLRVSHNLLTSLKTKAARKMRHLDTLILSSNHISCISQKAINKMTKLKKLDVSSNPLTCDCRVSWLNEWLTEHETEELPQCNLPVSLRGSSLPHATQMQCPVTTSPADCDSSSPTYCPPECQCRDKIVRCSRAGLKQIPRGIPHDTLELYMDMNEIKSVNSERLHHLRQLRRLDLSNNQITILSNKTFSALQQLSTLIVSFNKLGCVERDSFVGLKSLRILNLYGNDVSFLPDGSFRELSKNTHVALGNNPLYCDCSMAWLAKFVKDDHIVEPGTARCADPPPMMDKLVLTTSPQDFVCSHGAVPHDVLAKCDLCYTQPCLNGGTCRTLPNREYECVCAPGYYGEECEKKIDACYGNPCDNGGTCKIYGMGRFTCHCPDGFDGLRCETNVDDCTDHKCMNGATCVDMINLYKCSCAAGFTGEYCSSEITFCSKEYNPCKNSGLCVDRGTSYSCDCVKGWTGENCTINVDDCLGHLCQNGAQCVDGVDAYECKCTGDWSGRYCETGPTVLQQTEPCLKHDCRNGVCTVPKGSNEYTCTCQSGYSGKYCEFLTSVRLVDKNSFLKLKAPEITSDINITLSIRSEVTDGVLAYLGHGRQHLAVEIFRGRLRVSYDVGNHPASNMFSYELLSDGSEHTVQLVASNRTFTLTVDGGLPRSVVNDGQHSALQTKGEPLYIGGVPATVAKHAHNLWHLRNTTSFRGCVLKVEINRRVQDLSRIQKENKVVPGCGTPQQHDEAKVNTQNKLSSFLQKISQPKNKENARKAVAKVVSGGDDVCSSHQCEQGRCKPRKRRPGYRCRCTRGWAGKYCNRAPTCRRTSTTAHLYDENKCRSARPLRQFSCAGRCGRRSCCVPKRFRVKKVAMICTDGTKYTKVVKLLRKCACSSKCE